jgi:hypothetical protein
VTFRLEGAAEEQTPVAFKEEYKVWGLLFGDWADLAKGGAGTAYLSG